MRLGIGAAPNRVFNRGNISHRIMRNYYRHTDQGLPYDTGIIQLCTDPVNRLPSGENANFSTNQHCPSIDRKINWAPTLGAIYRLFNDDVADRWISKISVCSVYSRAHFRLSVVVEFSSMVALEQSGQSGILLHCIDLLSIVSYLKKENASKR